MTVQEVSDFIETLPEHGSSLTKENTHLVYLVRDPRGVINSIQVIIVGKICTLAYLSS